MIAAGAVVVVLAGGGVAWAQTRSSGPAYRLATVSRSNVAQTITEVGTISSVNQRSVSFPVAGTVKTVTATLGDTVNAGQTLATLDTTSLTEAVESANGTLASARQRLADDEASETSADSTDSYSETQLGAATASPSRPPTGGQSISALQAAVVADQKTVDAGLATVTSDLNALKTACTSSTVTFTVTSDANGIITGTVTGGAGLPISIPSDTDAAGASIPASTVASDGTYTFGSTSDPLRASASYTVQLGDDGAGVTAATSCQTALETVQNDEQTVATSERKLATDEQALDAALKASESGTGSTGGTGGTGSTGKGGGTGTGSSGGTGGKTGSSGTGRSSSSGTSSSGGGSTGFGGGTTTTVITAEQLAADQKSIDAAAAELVVVQQNLSAASLTAPISGTVADVSITAGSSVSASSSSSTITIIGTGQKAVTTTVGIASIDLVKQGDTASVTVDGVSKPLPGKVTQVGVLNTSGTSGDTTTYPVTIVLDSTTVPLYDGAGATVAIDVGTADNVLTVPSSALTSIGTGALVSVYAKGKVTRQAVTTGVVGIDRTEIKTGLKAGQQVVLANLHEAVPSSTTTNSRLTRLTGGGGLGSITGGFGGGTGFTRGGN